MNVTVFGSSTPSPTDYDQAEKLGRLLGRAGHTVLTGGYSGIMEAVSKGAAETGGHVIGVTCVEIECWRPSQANHWVMEERRCLTLRERLFELIENCNAAIALPGGGGTLTEIVLMWNLLFTQAIPPRPLILVGNGWLEIFSQFFGSQGSYVPEYERRWLAFAKDVVEAVEMIQIE